MEEPKNEMLKMMEELENMKKAMQATQPQTTIGSGVLSAWQQAKPQASNVDVEKVLVPVEIGVKTGNVTVYFQFSGEIAKTPDTLLNTVEGLISANVPVKAWQPKNAGNQYKR